MYHHYDDLSKSQQEVTDYMLPMGAVLIFATTFAIINLLFDILYVYVDPRIRYDGLQARKEAVMAQNLTIGIVDHRALWSETLRQLRQNIAAMLSLMVLVLLAVVAIFAHQIAPYDPNDIDLFNGLQSPFSSGHLLGTDDLGRDVLSRLIHGSRTSLVVGFIVVGIAGSIGVTLGAISGYFGGAVDMVIMRIVDLLFAFPFLILALAFVAILGPSLTNMMLALGLVSWIGYARLVRAVVLSLREMTFVMAARALGASDMRILTRHILPNVVGIVVVQATFGVAQAILAAAALSFLGMGVQPPNAEWGNMLTKMREFMRIRPVLVIAPGLMIMITVLSLNFVGDALRDTLDPYMRL